MNPTTGHQRPGSAGPFATVRLCLTGAANRVLDAAFNVRFYRVRRHIRRLAAGSLDRWQPDPQVSDRILQRILATPRDTRLDGDDDDDLDDLLRAVIQATDRGPRGVAVPPVVTAGQLRDNARARRWWRPRRRWPS